MFHISSLARSWEYIKKKQKTFRVDSLNEA